MQLHVVVAALLGLFQNYMYAGQLRLACDIQSRELQQPDNTLPIPIGFWTLEVHTPRTKSGIPSQFSPFLRRLTAMATNGAGSYAPVLTALATMQSNDRSQKAQAHEYLEAFQKSVGKGVSRKLRSSKADIPKHEAWSTTFSVLQASETSPEAKLFAATTLKGKV